MNILTPIRRGLALLCLSATVTQAQVANLYTLPYQQVVTAGRSVSFLATGATGTVQWQVSTTGMDPWSNLSDDARYHGTTTSSLEIAGVPPDSPPQYYRFTSTTGSVVTASSATKLVVSPLLLPAPAGIILDRANGLLVTDTTSHTVRQISNVQDYTLVYHACATSVFAGVPNQAGYTTFDPTEPADTYFNQPNGLIAATPGAPIETGGVYVADSANGIIRLLKDNTSKLQAGSNSERGNVDGTGNAALFGRPMGLARAADGAFLVTDSTCHTIRRMTTAGVVTTFAGVPEMAGWTDGNGGAARFNGPTGIAVDDQGTIFVADTLNNVIRKITPAGDVTTLAGLAGVAGSQDGTGAQALFNGPTGLAIGFDHELFVADTGNSTIRLIVTTDGSVTTYAGIPTVSGLREGKVSQHGDLSNGENSYSIDALFNHPTGLVCDYATGELYVADTGNAAIRVVDIDNDYRNATGTTTLLLTADTYSPPPSSPPSTTTSTPSKPASATSSGGGGAIGGDFLAAVGGLWLLRILAKIRRKAGRRGQYVLREGR